MQWVYVAWFLFVGITMIYLAVFDGDSRFFSVLSLKLMVAGIVFHSFQNWAGLGLELAGYGVVIAAGACIAKPHRLDSELVDWSGR
jgi:hypothetical protein|tara:strand:+ start:6145 stop:6402 length:258 start_codon:yes stop_codon:yes gene_type:complete